MDFSFVYITANDMAEAQRIGRVLVEERLAACANCIDGMKSVYWWEGKIDEAAEAVCIVKTRSSLVDTLAARVKALHSYDVPCIVAMKIDNGNPAFFQWIRENTRDA